ncbi:MAG: cupredoxin domain-containing protein [Byssovorax sp.]
MKPPTKPRSISALVVLAVASALTVGEACSKSAEPSAQAAPGQTGAAQTVASNGRRIDITATSEGYSPATVDVKKGEEVVLRFTRTTKSECLAEVVIPDLKIKKDLPLNTAVEIPVKLDKEGKVGFQCGMAMVKGTINVTGG